MENKPRNQGEGDWESAKRYNEKTKKFVESGKVGEAARNAGKGDKQEMERAVSGPSSRHGNAISCT
jgi:hypothetical protein